MPGWGVGWPSWEGGAAHRAWASRLHGMGWRMVSGGTWRGVAHGVGWRMARGGAWHGVAHGTGWRMARDGAWHGMAHGTGWHVGVAGLLSQGLLFVQRRRGRGGGG